MGMIGKLVGGPGAVAAVGEEAKGLAEVFTPSATRKMELSAEAQMEAMKQYGAEFQIAPAGWFDRLVNGLNRLPRPMLAFGTIGLFVYAMVDPGNFAQRMVGLNAVPEPLWWLLGAVVGFYFGAREAHYFRMRPVTAVPPTQTAAKTEESSDLPAVSEGNAAIDDWRQQNG
jgi:hypothetical protein